MYKIKVTPVNGVCEAPYYIEEIDSKCKTPEQEAISRVKQRTRLSDFDNWVFITEFIYN